MDLMLVFISYWWFGLSFWDNPNPKPVRVGLWEKFDKYSLPTTNVYNNFHEIKNQKDDDCDGYIDNINGIGFNINEQPVPEYFYCQVANAQEYHHGTAVASILLQHNPNIELYGVGFVPTSQRLQESGILSLSVNERLAGLSKEYAQMKVFIDSSLAYFAKMKCRVVTISWGLDINHFAKVNQNLGYTDTQRKAKAKEWLLKFKEYLEAGFRYHSQLVFVVAVGNDGKNIYKSLDVPACIQLPNVVRVGALEGKKRASYSNYGKGVVYAQGTNIIVTKALKQIQSESGTSLATPVIAAEISKKMSE